MKVEVAVACQKLEIIRYDHDVASLAVGSGLCRDLCPAQTRICSIRNLTGATYVPWALDPREFGGRLKLVQVSANVSTHPA